jgi:hypothetical protein
VDPRAVWARPKATSLRGEAIEPSLVAGADPWWRALASTARSDAEADAEEPPSLPPPVEGISFPLD